MAHCECGGGCECSLTRVSGQKKGKKASVTLCHDPDSKDPDNGGSILLACGGGGLKTKEVMLGTKK